MTPLVRASIILPIYNGATYLQGAIDSILGQTVQDFEIIAVNDGSTDDSASILAQNPGIKVIEQSNSGVAIARNTGIEGATGEYLCFIDQDDSWHPEKLEAQFEVFKHNPDYKYCTTKQTFYLAKGIERPEWCPEDWLNKPLAGYAPSTLMINRRFLLDFGIFDTSLPVGSDTDLFFRLKDAKIGHEEVDRVLVRKRVHTGNQSAFKSDLKRDIMETIKRSIMRQRMKAAKPN